MSRKLTTSIALSAMLAVFATPIMAQEAAPAAPAADAPAETVALPQILKAAGLTDVTSSKMRRGDGTRIHGTLPGGEKIGAMLDDKGDLRGVRSMTEGAALPQALVDQLVPQNVRDNAILSQLGHLSAVFTGERGVMLAGKDAQGNNVRAAFAPDGTLIRFARGDEDGPGKGRRGMGMGEGPDHDHDDAMRGDRDGDMGMMPHRGGPQEGDMPPPPPPPVQGGAEDAPVDPQQGASAPAGMDAGRVRSTLTEAGYTNVGQITQNGPRVLVMALNPDGEPVLVELGRDGVVLREVAR